VWYSALLCSALLCSALLYCTVEVGCNDNPSTAFVWSDASPSDYSQAHWVASQYPGYCQDQRQESWDCVADHDGGDDVPDGILQAVFCELQKPYVCGTGAPAGGGNDGPPSSPVSATPWLSSYTPSTSDCPLQDVRARIAELDAICCADRPGQHNCDSSVLNGAPNTCSVACGAKLTTLYHQCNSTLDILFDGMDDEYDGHAQVFEDLRTMCSERSSGDVIAEIKLLQDEGCVINANGVGEMVVDDGSGGAGSPVAGGGDCQDTGSRKMCRLVTSGALSCDTDFCSDSAQCAHAGECDKTCGFCGGEEPGKGRRALQIDFGDSCTALNLQSKVEPVNGACCDEDGTCAGGGLGVPTVCDAKCAIGEMHPFTSL
jgi:hypothetical protein